MIPWYAFAIDYYSLRDEFFIFSKPVFSFSQQMLGKEVTVFDIRGSAIAPLIGLR